MSAQGRPDATTTSLAPASRCSHESLPGRSMSNSWCACLIVATLRPRPTRTGMTLVISVVLPEPLQPARPMMRIGMGFDLRIGLAIRLGRDRRPYDKDRFGLLRPSSMAETTFDLRGLKCPLPVLRTRKALAGMRPGDI